MPTARKNQISLTDTPYYHCISRCVRRAFLCGQDKITGQSYEHRKQWVADKLAELAHVFAIEVYAYAIMSNHTHTVLKVNTAMAENWSRDEVIARWMQLFSGNLLIQRYLNGDCKTLAEISQIHELVETWRNRLTDISWFMRCLNESIARKANAEDKCTGRFWEGRFKSQALLNEQALLACMVYVDLNPIRAGLSERLADSEFTSIAQRIHTLSDKTIHKPPTATSDHTPSDDQPNKAVIPLTPFIGARQTNQGIAYHFTDYLELTDWTGRGKRQDKKGHIPASEPKIIQQLGISADIWQETVDSFTHRFFTYIGSEAQLKTILKKQQKQWLTGIQACRRLFATTNRLQLKNH